MVILFYDLMYVILNLLGTYITYKFMGIFFNREGVNTRLESISYVVYFFVTTIVYLNIGIPLINVIVNIVAFYLISLNYKAEIKNRVIAVVMIYFIMAAIETIIALLTNYYHGSLLQQSKYFSVAGMISIKIITFAVVSLLEKSRKIKLGEKIPRSYWLCLVLVPVASIYITLTIFSMSQVITEKVVISMILLLLLNVSVFYLYERLSAFFAEDMKKSILLEQNQFYDQQLKLMQEHLRAMSALKHDLKNHLYSVSTLIKDHRQKESLDYLSQMIEVCDHHKDYSRTQNITIDSILNFKLEQAKHKCINVTLDTQIPMNMQIASFDMTIILGNLLDNAMEALERVKSDQRYLKIWIKYNKGRLIIKVINPFEGSVKKEGEDLLTTKIEQVGHGIGLKSIKEVVQKYDGEIKITYEDHIFAVMLLMYID